MKTLFAICLLLIVSASGITDTTQNKTIKSDFKQNIDSINTYSIKFRDIHNNKPAGEISGYSTGIIPVVKINGYGVWGGCLSVTGDITTDGTLSAKGYKTASGAVGKTYTEEFEDKQGNLRTRVYENGLLVSYKINGVEQ